MQRKTSTSIAAKDKDKKKEPGNISKPPQRKISSEDNSVVNPVLAGIIQRSNNPQTTTITAPATATTTTPNTSALGESYKAVAKSAVGRGIRHNFTSRTLPPVASAAVARPDETTSQHQAESNLSQDSLTQLATNYRNSLIDFHGNDSVVEDFKFDADPTPLSQMQGDETTSSSGFFSRDPSLLDLAMIPEAEEGGGLELANGFNFVDFPNPEVRPKGSEWDDNL